MKSTFLVIILIGLAIMSLAQSLPKEGALFSSDGKYILVRSFSHYGTKLDSNNIFSIVDFNTRFPSSSFKINLNLSKDSIEQITKSEAYYTYKVNRFNSPCRIATFQLYYLNYNLDTAITIHEIVTKNDSIFFEERNIYSKSDNPLLQLFLSTDNCFFEFRNLSGLPISDFIGKYNLSVSLKDCTTQLVITIDTLKIEKEKSYDNDSLNRYTCKFQFRFQNQLLWTDTVETNVASSMYVVADNPVCPVAIEKLREIYEPEEFVKLFYDSISKFYYLKTNIHSSIQSFEIKPDEYNNGVYYTIINRREGINSKATFGFLKN